MSHRPRLVFPGKSLIAAYCLLRLSSLQSAAKRTPGTRVHKTLLRARAALLAGSLSLLGVDL